VFPKRRFPSLPSERGRPDVPGARSSRGGACALARPWAAQRARSPRRRDHCGQAVSGATAAL